MNTKELRMNIKELRDKIVSGELTREDVSDTHLKQVMDGNMYEAEKILPCSSDTIEPDSPMMSFVVLTGAVPDTIEWFKLKTSLISYDDDVMSPQERFDCVKEWSKYILDKQANIEKDKDSHIIDGRPTVDIDGHKCHINIGYYQSDPMVMSIRTFIAEDNPKLDDWKGEPWSVISVNLGSFSGNDSFVQKNTTFIDTNNNGYGGTLPAVYEALGAKPYMRFGDQVFKQSGFCSYPLMMFDSEKLKEYDPEGYEIYSKSWDNALPKMQRKLRKKLFGSTLDEANSFTSDDKTDVKGLGE